jgi:hypothetical protein
MNAFTSLENRGDRQTLAADADASENVRRAEKAGCILIEDRAFLRRCPL